LRLTLGAIVEHQAEALSVRAGVVAGLDSVLLVAATVAFPAAVLAWPLLGAQRSTRPEPGES
jgi:hypothetical protein